MNTLKTGIKNVRNVSHYLFGRGKLKLLADLLRVRRTVQSPSVIFIVDGFFKYENKFVRHLPIENHDLLISNFSHLCDK